MIIALTIHHPVAALLFAVLCPLALYIANRRGGDRSFLWTGRAIGLAQIAGGMGGPHWRATVYSGLFTLVVFGIGGWWLRNDDDQGEIE